MPSYRSLFTAVAGAALAAALCPVAAHAQTLDIKPGAWEITVVTDVATRGLPPELAELPPEKRARVEAALKARQGKGKPHVSNSCLTRADIAQMARPGDDDDENCRYGKPTVSGKTWKGEGRCTNGRTMTAAFTADSPERVHGTIVTKVPTPQGPNVVTATVDSKWLGADCKKHNAD